MKTLWQKLATLRQRNNEFEKFLLEELAKVCRLLKEADMEIEAHQNAITALMKTQPELRESLDAYLTAARQSPALRERVNQKYTTMVLKMMRGLPDKTLRSLEDFLSKFDIHVD